MINALRCKGEMKQNKLRRRDLNDMLRQCGDSLGQGREESPGGREILTSLWTDMKWCEKTRQVTTSLGCINHSKGFGFIPTANKKPMECFKHDQICILKNHPSTEWKICWIRVRTGAGVVTGISGQSLGSKNEWCSQG